MKPSELLSEALEAFGPNGERWLQREAWDQDAKACAMGMLTLRAYRVVLAPCPLDDARQFLDAAAEDLFPGFVRDLSPFAPAAQVNDRGTFEDVVLMYKHAIAAAEADGR